MVSFMNPIRTNSNYTSIKSKVMKKMLLITITVASFTILRAQTLQLPGIGSNNVTVSAAQINSNTLLSFLNPEYNVEGFTVKFAAINNPAYSANSTNNQFTSDMLTNIPLLVAGSNIELNVTLKEPGEHAPWQKTYYLLVNN